MNPTHRLVMKQCKGLHIYIYIYVYIYLLEVLYIYILNQKSLTISGL